jgi:DNA-binding response OmpR family regulator
MPVSEPVRVLVVEDDQKLERFLTRALSEEGYETSSTRSGREALTLCEKVPFSAILLDWMLPDIDGDEICRLLRAKGIMVPIILLTARIDIADRVKALDDGADDYVGKPFHLDELLARIRAVIRRKVSLPTEVLRVGPISVDLATRLARIDGINVDLTLREYDLLVFFMRHAGQVVTRLQMLENVWHTHRDPGSNLIEVNISNLRDKLGKYATMLTTVRGKGYRLHLDVSIPVESNN